MASIRKEIIVAAPPALVWDAVRDVGALHRRLVPGFVVDTRMEPGLRVVTFASGQVLRERIVACDDSALRLVWAIEDAWLDHHNGALEVAAAGGNSSRVTWTTDLLPDDRAEQVSPLMERGLAVLRATLEAVAASGQPARDGTML